MVEFIHQFASPASSKSGARYLARVYADRQPRGLWEAWFVFFPVIGEGTLATDRETTQSKLEDVVYWAHGITPVYLEGALQRAIEQLPETRLLRHIDQAERAEA
jgi:hypothetical protein